MNKRQYKNGPSTALSGSILAADTAIAVTSGTGFPAGGDFTIKVDGELLLVTGVSGTTWTVSRGREGTTAASHGDGAPVSMVLTAGDLDNLVTVSKGGTIVSTRRQVNLVDSASVTWTATDDPTNDKVDVQAAASGGGGGSTWEKVPNVPALANYSWLNQGTASAVDDGTGIYIKAPAASQNNIRALVIPTGSTPWTYVAKLIPAILDGSSANCGILVQSSATSEIQALRLINSTLDIQFFHSPTSYDTGSLSAITLDKATPFRWFKVADDGTNRTWHVSVDGLNWIQVKSDGHTFGLTADHVGFYVEGATAGLDSGAKLVSGQLT